MHPGEHNGPKTIFAPTPTQYDGLVAFVSGPPPSVRLYDTPFCPLPIHPRSDNCWRFHPAEAMGRFNIFRDRHERIPTQPHEKGQETALDWPELYAESVIADAWSSAEEGLPMDRMRVEEALERLQRITPSSPLWDWWHELDDPATSEATKSGIMASLGFGDPDNLTGPLPLPTDAPGPIEAFSTPTSPVERTDPFWPRR